MPDPLNSKVSDRGSSLSPRETQVLELAILGLTNQQIATRLNVSVHAIKFHLSSVFRKLKVSNRTEAAVAYVSSTGGSSTDSAGARA